LSQPLAEIARKLNQGAVIAYPTEAVWGLGCDPYNQQAVEQLLALKSRPVDKGVILVAANTEQLGPLLDKLTTQQRQRLDETWPGPVTWLIPDPDDLFPSWVKGQHSAVAIRVSAHPLVAQLCQAFGGLLVSTSANPAGLEPAMNKAEVSAYFESRVNIVDGELGGANSPSQIRDLASDAVLR